MTATFRFVHTADLHLDSPFQGLTKISSSVREILQDATLAAFDAIVDKTIEADAAFLLVAGDIYDGADRGIRAQLRFRAGLDRLSRRGIQTFIVHGNHDPLEGWSAISSWPDGVTNFPQREVLSVPVERSGRRLATVHGISFGEGRPARSASETSGLRGPRRTLPLGDRQPPPRSSPGHSGLDGSLLLLTTL